MRRSRPGPTRRERGETAGEGAPAVLRASWCRVQRLGLVTEGWPLTGLPLIETGADEISACIRRMRDLKYAQGLSALTINRPRGVGLRSFSRQKRAGMPGQAGGRHDDAAGFHQVVRGRRGRAGGRARALEWGGAGGNFPGPGGLSAGWAGGVGPDAVPGSDAGTCRLRGRRDRRRDGAAEHGADFPQGSPPAARHDAVRVPAFRRARRGRYRGVVPGAADRGQERDGGEGQVRQWPGPGRFPAGVHQRRRQLPAVRPVPRGPDHDPPARRVRRGR